MKRAYLLALVLLIPICALAGMKVASDEDMEAVQGQVGITITMATTVSAGDISWEDKDGFTGGASTGAVVLSGVTTPAINISNVIIDAGTTAGVSYLQIDTGVNNIISGDFVVNSIVIGNLSTATLQDLGKLRVRSTRVSVGTIKISGH